MSSFFKHFQRKEKCENMVKNKLLNNMKESDMKVAEGRAKYYTADEVRAKLEDLFNEKV